MRTAIMLEGSEIDFNDDEHSECPSELSSQSVDADLPLPPISPLWDPQAFVAMHIFG